MSDTILLLILFISVVTDLLTGKVKNKIIIIGILSGLGFRTAEMGIPGLYQGVVDFVLPTVVLSIFFICKVFGAGDIKLFSVIGSFLGGRAVCLCFVTSVFIGAILSIAKILHKKILIRRLQHFAKLVWKIVFAGCIKSYDEEAIDKNCTIHFTIPIFISVLLYMEGFI